MIQLFARPRPVAVGESEVVQRIESIRFELKEPSEHLMLDWLSEDLKLALVTRGRKEETKTFAALPERLDFQSRNAILNGEIPTVCHLSNVKLTTVHNESLLSGLFEMLATALADTRIQLFDYTRFQSTFNQYWFYATFAINIKLPTTA